MLRIKYVVTFALLLIICQGLAEAADRTWFFTADEIKVAYRYQEQYGRRLAHPLRPTECFYGATEFVASSQETKFSVPCRVISETVRHLKEGLELGAVQYLFPLDGDHAHLLVPSELWETKYKDMPSDQWLPEALREPSLVAVYHTAEHLELNGKTKARKQKRNLIGHYDGRRLELLRPEPDGSGVMPEGYRPVATLHFLAHHLGELAFSAKGKSFVFDISFDDDLAEGTPWPVR